MESFLSKAIVSVFLSPLTQVSPWLGDQTYLVLSDNETEKRDCNLKSRGNRV